MKFAWAQPSDALLTHNVRAAPMPVSRCQPPGRHSFVAEQRRYEQAFDVTHFKPSRLCQPRRTFRWTLQIELTNFGCVHECPLTSCHISITGGAHHSYRTHLYICMYCICVYAQACSPFWATSIELHIYIILCSMYMNSWSQQNHSILCVRGGRRRPPQ